MNRRQFLTLGLILPFVPQIKPSPQFENTGLVFPMAFAEDVFPEHKPLNTSNVQIISFKSESLFTKLCHWLQTIK